MKYLACGFVCLLFVLLAACGDSASPSPLSNAQAVANAQATLDAAKPPATATPPVTATPTLLPLNARIDTAMAAAPGLAVTVTYAASGLQTAAILYPQVAATATSFANAIATDQIKLLTDNVRSQTTPRPVVASTSAPTNDALKYLDVTSVRTETTIDTESPKAGNIFLVLDVHMMNPTNGNISANPASFTVRTKSGYSYSYAPATFLLPKALKLTDLAPGEDTRGELAFELPTDETAVSITFSDFRNKITIIFGQ